MTADNSSQECPKRAALYARVSTGKQAVKGLSIPDQVRHLREYCKAKGWEVSREFIEPGATATNDRRAAFQEMIELATDERRPIDILLVHSFSRYFRDAYLFEMYARQLEQNGVALVSATQNVSDDPSGKLMRGIMAHFDQYSSQESSKHIKRAMIESARQGFWHGTRPPFGYRSIVAERRGDKLKKKLEIDPAEAPTVIRMFDLVRRGNGSGPMGVKKLVAYLNDTGVRNRGRLWNSGQVYAMLTNETYVGRHYFNKKDFKAKRLRPREEWINIKSPQIIDESVFVEVQALLRERHRGKTPPRITSSSVLLGGLLRCADCGRSMMLTTGKGGRYRYYTCAGKRYFGDAACRGRSVRVEVLDKVVLDHLSERLFNRQRLEELLAEVIKEAKRTDKPRRQEVRSIERAIRETDLQIGRLYEAIERGIIPLDDELQKRLVQHKQHRLQQLQLKGEVERRIAAQDRLIQPGDMDAFCSAMRKSLQAENVQFAKPYVRLFVERIVVSDTEVRVRGSKNVLAAAAQEGDDGEIPSVPSFVREWWALQGSNLRPLPCRGSALPLS